MIGAPPISAAFPTLKGDARAALEAGEIEAMPRTTLQRPMSRARTDASQARGFTMADTWSSQSGRG
jgi:hypothetical protein